MMFVKGSQTEKRDQDFGVPSFGKEDLKGSGERDSIRRFASKPNKKRRRQGF